MRLHVDVDCCIDHRNSSMNYNYLIAFEIGPVIVRFVDVLYRTAMLAFDDDYCSFELGFDFVVIPNLVCVQHV